MKNHASPFLVCLLSLSSLPALATRHQVPQQFSTIQSAIDAAATGDTVLVAPGTYFENLKFKGKNITVASTFLLSGDYTAISQTIINGSQPANADTASVVRFINGEGPGAVLAGFTLTGGTGTKWPDNHNGLKYREGGAILIENSSPTIRYNYITKNVAVSTSGVASAGGGAIRMDGGQPRILNNVITNNQGRYGAGIVLNYSGAIIRNNIIAQNRGGQDYGGAGIWILETFTQPIIIENNTITGNVSSTTGGGVQLQQTNAIFRNNIVWGNAAQSAAQVSGTNQITATYNNVQGTTPLIGTGNTAQNPLFGDAALLTPFSFGVDLGDPAAAFNDPEDPASQGNALAPSMFTVRNDMGAYGGPDRSDFSDFAAASIGVSNSFNVGAAPIGSSVLKKIFVINRGLKNLNIDSVKVMLHPNEFAVTPPANTSFIPMFGDTIRLTWTPLSSGPVNDTLLIYHNDPETPNPKKVRLFGSAITGVSDELTEGTSLQLFPNPAGSTATLIFEQKTSSGVVVSITDLTGRDVYQQTTQQLSPGVQQLKVNVSTLPAGCYVVTIRSTSGTGVLLHTTRLLKE